MEKWLLVFLFLFLLAIKVAYALNFRIESDELQHLHVVWGWVTGRLPYRDIFDNHGPLFHLLCAPIFSLFGERADIVIPMRFAMFPLWLWSLWSVYAIGKSLYSPRIAAWAVLLAAFFPEFLFTSTEFRTDDLWMALWLSVLSILIGAKLTRARAFVAGLLLGAAFTVTVKTGLMLGAVTVAGVWIWIWKWKRQETIDWKPQFGFMVAGGLGLAILPLAFALFFWSRGAFDAFVYCNITHNLVPHTQNWNQFDGHLLWLPLAIVAAVIGLFRSASLQEAVWVRRIFLALVTLFYFAALKTLFPTLTRQDDLPYLPLLAIFASAAIHYGTRPQAMRFMPKMGTVCALLVVVVANIGLAFRMSPPLQNKNREEIAMIADTLRVTKRSDLVMDAIGETIFRDRPFYYAIEAFTKARFAVGSIPNRIAERLVETGTAVVRPRGLPESTKRFIDQNYVGLGADLCVLGKIIPVRNGNGRDPIHFTSVIPGRFVVISKQGKLLSGKVDGVVFNGSCALSIGEHALFLDNGMTDRMAIFWENAFLRGFLPFKRP
ncbi:hypothetical protein CfE428DRAFT_2067 [Chthoniobacter flavus Ellin428]|uniref:Glycosyltransferase RgtA/B/C/D-like domain-containing protein n=1 Tax=Chthoniobacter flavus Ellin428 TaxID=497964 RepID=B4CZH9_9BACT|nr:glycosyltransferase family 39 protein [Chthoniobacter flavus]EDY20143.1 hypothetical protein CfE428DRAFT_2067 [Chthoniobacter flavus Ellin428]TCO94041.1 dolichyl-phosphate-mannose-protein mannosyltransferase [Chthoniobacter flavus]